VGYPEDVRYTQEHEWAREDGGLVTVGITGFATEQLGDVVYVDLPQAGAAVEAGKRFGEIEAVKTVSELYSPVSGEIAEVNGALADNPALVNQSPYGDGWLVKIRPSQAAEFSRLLTHVDYEKLVEESH
jgi:glycine cleavage system H protein